MPALLLFVGVLAADMAIAQSAAEPGPWRQSSPAPARLQVLLSEGESLVDIPIRSGERWCLAWNHSVTGIRVLDCYRNLEGRMLLERSHQPDFAAGLGHMPGRGIQKSDAEGGYWIEHIDEPVPGNHYLLRVGSMAVDHRIVWNDTVTSLSALAAGERVTIRLHSNPQPFSDKRLSDQ